jgi:hypothetical protein
MGAPNLAEFVPPHSVVEVRAFGGRTEEGLAKLAAHLNGLLDEPERYYTEYTSST